MGFFRCQTLFCPRRILALVAVIVVFAALLGFKPDTTSYLTAPVTRQDIEATITAVGTLRPRRYVDVGAQVSGQITRLRVEPGDAVDKGQLLVEIDPSLQQSVVDADRAQLAGLRAQLADQQAQHRLAEQQLARQQRLDTAEVARKEDLQIAEANLASAAARIDHLTAQISQTQATLKADETQLGFTRIYAPISGTVVSIAAREGQTLNATYQTPDILRIADLSGMTVWTEVSEADIGRVKSGMPVYFTVLGELSRRQPRQWEGVVRQVLPAPPAGEAAGDSASAAALKAVMYTVLFDVANDDGALMPQMTAQVSFVTARAEGVLSAPLSALEARPEAASPDDYQVRVLRGDGAAETRPVETGIRDKHTVEIRSGLAEGDVLITGEAADDGRLPWLTW